MLVEVTGHTSTLPLARQAVTSAGLTEGLQLKWTCLALGSPAFSMLVQVEHY